MSNINYNNAIVSKVVFDSVEESRHFNSYADGDMEDEDHREDLRYSLNRFPIGTKIVIMIPTCEDCGLDETECDCGTDWSYWHGTEGTIV